MLEEFEYNGKAMGTDYSIAIVCPSRELSDNIYKIAKGEIDEAEARFSRFLPSSELSKLNEIKKMVVSDQFLEITQKAYELFTKTKGIFNPLVQVARLGYDKNFDELENDKIVEEEGPYDIDFSSVIIDQEQSMIILAEGQRLDYGGFLKGYLSEIIAKKIKLNYPPVAGVIVNIGGDLHTQGKDKDGNKFIFSIYNPVQNNEDEVIPLFNQSLATSGTYKRNWLVKDKKVHHILDASGYNNPETEIISVSIIHPDGAHAEAYTKVFLSMDYTMALELLKDENLSFIIIKKDGQIIKSI